MDISTTPSNTRFGSAVRRGVLLGGAAAPLLLAASALGAPPADDWSPAEKLDETGGNHADVNSPGVDGCPVQSPDGLSLYFASNRDGGQGGLDIWVTNRLGPTAPWGAPQNLPAPVNSPDDDFCPAPLDDGGLYFVSRRTIEGVTCGMGDIYLSQSDGAFGWSEPEHLACGPDGPNSELDEQGPTFAAGRLYFSSSSDDVPGDLFVSAGEGADFGPATAVAELNDPAANDVQPNITADGLELVFTSNREGGVGGQDIWSSIRPSADSSWSAPVNLGDAVNTPAGETRPSLSADGAQLLFGRAGAEGTGEGGTGAADIYVTTRPVGAPAGARVQRPTSVAVVRPAASGRPLAV